MKQLLEYLVKNITGSDECTIEENTDNNHTTLTVSAPKSIMGLLIGKNGSTVKALRNIVKVKATLEKVGVSVFIQEA
jgi:predicted RNA-binding protein YlqC (UPF0109 family)